MIDMHRVALVTGSSKGIGRGIVLASAKAGFNVAIHYLHSSTEAAVVQVEAEQHGVDALTLRADVTDVTEAQELIDSPSRYPEAGLRRYPQCSCVGFRRAK